MKRIFDKLKEMGIRNTSKGIFITLYYKIIQNKFHFDKWHISPIYLRKYALDILSWCNEHKFTGSVVEIGCGLGEIVREIDAYEKYGFDIEKNVINAAKFLDKERSVKWILGSFADVKINGNISVLIAVNFIHSIDKNTLSELFKIVTNANKIQYIIVDSVKKYTYYHDFVKDNILPSRYQLYAVLGEYKSEREVLIFEKKKVSSEVR